ncbi:hypothetical protein LRAMOSA09892 [Lichtheimia ramosa]|uniref:Periplasmic binding protein n=1 Tax=Lichtheimia ramosa TaxID=688394 RepID=A0A077WLH7_9FUNG|nr:hypothetical protein LRAMOSA09892 [Lichtheimia ramosa]
MTRLHRVAAAGIACLAFAGVHVSAQNLQNGQCVTNFDANTDYFPEKLNTREEDEAKYFAIEYHNNYKVITDHRNEKQYYLVQCGTTAPSVPQGTAVYNVPLTSVAALETTVVPYLEVLGVAESIHLVADASSVTSSCFQKYRQESNNVTEMSSTNVTLANQQADTVQIQFGTSYYTTDATVATAQSYEPDILGRAAWIGYYAAFFNLESLANDIIANITNNYNSLKEASSHYSDNEKPLVAWTMYDAPSQYNGNKASWNISTAAYKAQLTQDAGARFLNSSQLQFFDNAEFLKAITDVDVIIDETYIATTMDDLLKAYGISDDGTYKFVTNKAMYREDGIMTPSGGYDWFSGAIVFGDALLEDVINAVNPSAPTSDFKRYWLRNVALNESIYYTDPKNCTWDETAPRPNPAITYTGDAFKMEGAASSSFVVGGWSTTLVALLTTAYVFLA